MGRKTLCSSPTIKQTLITADILRCHVEVPSRSLIESELNAMYEIVKHLLNQKVVKTYGFTEVKSGSGDSYSIADMSYNDKTYYMVLVEEGEQESGIFIRSSLVPELEIILPLPQMIRMTSNEAELHDDMC